MYSHTHVYTHSCTHTLIYIHTHVLTHLYTYTLMHLTLSAYLIQGNCPQKRLLDNIIELVGIRVNHR